MLCSSEQGLMGGKVGRWLGHKQRMASWAMLLSVVGPLPTIVAVENPAR